MATASQVVGVSKVSVTYSRPAVRGRVIWGDLVPWNEVWRTGANEATTITTNDTLVIGGQEPVGPLLLLCLAATSLPASVRPTQLARMRK